MHSTLYLTASLLLSLSALPSTAAQTPTLEPTSAASSRSQMSVITRTVQAVNYQHRSGATKIDFAGTTLMPSANGQAKIESKEGYIEIEVDFHNFDSPKTFGNEYLTYILWAISPEGSAVNLGEILIGSNHSGKLDVTTPLQAFALVVTA